MSDETESTPEYSKPLDGAPPSGDFTVRLRFGIAVGATLPVVPVLILFFLQLIIIEISYWFLR